jgi:hypothetical protein
LLVDLQPIDAAPIVRANGVQIGALEMSEWADVIATVDRGFATAISDGLFAFGHEEQYLTVDRYDDRVEFVEDQRASRGTKLDDDLAARALSADLPLTVHYQTRLRILSIP